MKIAVVTGASSGMGRQFVLALEQEYGTQLDAIWVIARRKEKLEALQAKSKIPLRVFAIDLQDSLQYQDYVKALEQEKPVVRVLINGAGIGKIGNFTKISRQGNLSMVELNCQVLTKVTYDTLPFMKKGSKVVNLASASAFLPQPGFGVYAASKSYVLSFSKFLYWEQKNRGIHSMAVCPGPVDTEFFQQAEEFEKMAPYKKRFLKSPERVVAKAMKDMKRGKTTSVYGCSMVALRVVTKLLPDTLILGVMNKYSRKDRCK